MRRLPLIVLLLMVVLGAGWWMLLISPRDAQIRGLEDELDAAMDAEALLRARISELEQVRDREVEYLVAVDDLETLIPDLPRLDSLIELIHGLTVETSITLNAMTLSEPAPSAVGDLREMRANLRIEGEFFQLLGFLFGLNDLERLVRVDSIAVSSGQDELGLTRLGVTLQVRAFTLADVLPEVIEPLPEIEDPFDDEPGSADDPAGQDDAGGDA
jgi:Tfp pilus assembly protein PilO